MADLFFATSRLTHPSFVMHAGNDLYQPDDDGAVTVENDVAVINQGWRKFV
jgi:hypothetical protein